jgi:ABC-type multidrug transport system ATPase subunit
LLLSSHDIHEVERLCDSVTLIEQGRVVISETLESLQNRFRKWTIQLRNPCESAPTRPGWLLVEQHNPVNWSLIEAQHNSQNSVQMIEEAFGPLIAHDSHQLSLREIYLSLAKEKKRRRKARSSNSATSNSQAST